MGIKFETFTINLINCAYKVNFHPLEVVGRGSETQLQVDKTLNSMMQRLKALRL